MKATAVLPVKRFAAAKQRLAPGIGATHRAELAAAMMEDALEAIGAARSIERVIVVSSEPRAIELATASGVEVLPDPGRGRPLWRSSRRHLPRPELGAGCVVLLPIDCPLLEPASSNVC